MELVSNILLIGGALGTAAYCLILSRRLRSFTGLEAGMGGAIAVLSAQVDDMTRALEDARSIAGGTVRNLADLTARATESTQRLELLLAALHDLPGEGAKPEPASTPGAVRKKRMVLRRGRSAASGMLQ